MEELPGGRPSASPFAEATGDERLGVTLSLSKGRHLGKARSAQQQAVVVAWQALAFEHFRQETMDLGSRCLALWLPCAHSTLIPTMAVAGGRTLALSVTVHVTW